MKRIDFENGTVTNNILSAALPMLIAQILNLLYNIVDRIYIARIHDIGTTALGAVGLCFPIIMIITAFSNLFGSGGAPIFSINRGKGDSSTDFRPVFELIRQEKERKELKNLRALIYFTDGDGIYPGQKPDYETAFVFLKRTDKMKLVPPWAKCLITGTGQTAEQMSV